MNGKLEVQQRLSQFENFTRSMRVDKKDTTTAVWGWDYYFNFKDWLAKKAYPSSLQDWAEHRINKNISQFGRRFEKNVWQDARSSVVRCRRIMCESLIA